jgi:pimeloyl-ACP methyl ester carboxylesterase
MTVVPSPYAAQLARVPVTDHGVDVLGSHTRYWEYGDPESATTLVVVHGFRGDHHGLEPVIAQLPWLRVISPDLPGFGESTPLSEAAHDIEGYGRWLRGFLDALDLHDAVLVGHSFGSIVVAAAVASGVPTPRMVLINPIAAPALSGPRGVLTRLAVFYYWLASVLPERAGFGLLQNRVIVRGMSMAMVKTRRRPLRRWVHDQHDRYFSAFSNRRVVLEAFRASVGSDVSEFAGDVAQPTLLVAAERDDITTVAQQQRLRGLFAQADLQVIPGVGHLIHYETPHTAAAHVARFVARGERE